MTPLDHKTRTMTKREVCKKLIAFNSGTIAFPNKPTEPVDVCWMGTTVAGRKIYLEVTGDTQLDCMAMDTLHGIFEDSCGYMIPRKYTA